MWKTVQLPDAMYKEVKKEVSRKGSLYTSISDFVTESVRHSLGGQSCKH